MTLFKWLTAGVIALIYAGIAIGRVPRLRMNRATIALVGAALLIAMGAISENQAFAAIDLGTLTLLFAIMIINVNLRLAGFFQWIGDRVLRLAHSPRALLAVLIAASGVLSALFLNDPICVLFAPLVIELTGRAKRDPIPYLLALALSANVGSVATITGNPQNLLIGQASHIPYTTFLLYLGPVALIGLVICWIALIIAFPDEFRANTLLTQVDLAPPRVYRPLLIRSLLVVAGLLIAFLSGLPIAAAALAAAGLLLVSRLRPSKLLRLDWDLLAFFGGLFMVTGAIESSGLSDKLFALIMPMLQHGVLPLTIITSILSNLVSNVPAVLLLRPEISQMSNPTQAWLTLAMASTLAGNFTLLGSVANLIVAESAAQRGVKVTFQAYLRVGVPVTILTIAVGVFWLSAIN